jgi:hypothetical protein
MDAMQMQSLIDSGQLVQSFPGPAVPQRRYLPTLSDLIDRLTIVQQKAIFISEKKDAYMAEMADIMHDVDMILDGLAVKGAHIGAKEVRAICVIMLSNRFIWENESKARAGGAEQDKLLKLTHSINGVRNAAKNELAAVDGGRHDFKLDCFAAELVAEFGNWDVFNGNGAA